MVAKNWAALETCGHQEAVGSIEATKCTEMISLQVPDGDVLIGNAGLFPFLLITGVRVRAQHVHFLGGKQF